MQEIPPRRSSSSTGTDGDRWRCPRELAIDGRPPVGVSRGAASVSIVSARAIDAIDVGLLAFRGLAHVGLRQALRVLAFRAAAPLPMRPRLRGAHRGASQAHVPRRRAETGRPPGAEQGLTGSESMPGVAEADTHSRESLACRWKPGTSVLTGAACPFSPMAPPLITPALHRWRPRQSFVTVSRAVWPVLGRDANACGEAVSVTQAAFSGQAWVLTAREPAFGRMHSEGHSCRSVSVKMAIGAPGAERRSHASEAHDGEVPGATSERGAAVGHGRTARRLR